jgi:superfamily II DNA or RNA helicase
MRNTFGNTWWGNQWLDALSNIDWDNRLPRGKAYATGGHVVEINFVDGEVRAKVAGSNPKPYKVTLSLAPFSAREKESLMRAIVDNTYFLSNLLTGELPIDLYRTLLMQKGIRLFPKSWNEVQSKCSCPDYASPCKHQAAVIYMIANQIDQNPFLVFALRGLDLRHELEKRGYVIPRIYDDIPDLFTIVSKGMQTLPFELQADVAELAHISLEVPDVSQRLIMLLSERPAFYSGKADFRNVYAKQIRILQNNAAAMLAPKARNNGQQANLLPVPMSVRRLHFIVEKGKVPVIEALTDKSPHHWRTGKDFLTWLTHLQAENLSFYAPDVQAFYTLNKFALLLLRQGGIIPQLHEVAKDKYAFRWLPALLITEVAEVIRQLAEVIPPNMLVLKHGKEEPGFLPPERQVAELLAYLITLHVHQICSSRGFDTTDDILSAFFCVSATALINAKDLDRRETPQNIRLWLRVFYLPEKQAKPILKVTESDTREDSLEMELLFQLPNDPTAEHPVELFKLFRDAEYAPYRVSILQDLAILSHHMAEITPVLVSQGVDVGFISINDFTRIFIDVLPVLRLLQITVMLPKEMENLLKLKPVLSMSKLEGLNEEKTSYLNIYNLELKRSIALGNQTISDEEFNQLIANTTGLAKINGHYVLIDPKEIEKLKKFLEQSDDLSPQESLQALFAEEWNGAEVRIDADLKKYVAELKNVDTVPLPTDLQAQLRPYQVRGFEWLYKNAKLGLGSILADDMGLGKTLQVITLLAKLKEEGELDKQKALVVAPTSLLTNWQKEIRRFAPGLRVEMFYGAQRSLPHPTTFDVLITSYGTLRNDWEEINKQKWLITVIDEAQNIKNPSTDQTKAVKKIKSKLRIAMSGTPVENRLMEYWSIMDFVQPKYLGGREHFQRTYAMPIEMTQDQELLDRFRRVTEPFIMRRLKTDKNIISDLPDKIEIDEYCTLTKEQAALYTKTYEQLMEMLKSVKGLKRLGIIGKILISLKQICNHPAQFNKKSPGDIALSGKAMRTMELLEEIYGNNEKVLIFSQYTEMCELLMQMHEERFGFTPLYFHGGCSAKQRDELVQNFQHEPQAKLMIISLKAGGTGLNLTQATRVIHYDLWWNPAVENQATDRAYRIGQTKNVFVHRLIVKGTFEEKINEMQSTKKALANLSVVEGEEWIGNLSDDDLMNIFKPE